MSGIIDVDGFQKVISKKKIRRNKLDFLKLDDTLDLTLEDFAKRYYAQFKGKNMDKAKILKKLNAIREEIVLTSFYKYATSTISKIHENNAGFQLKKIICLGLGSFGYFDYTPLYQLAFILEIQKHFNVPYILFQDPVFSDEEISFLENDLNNKMIENLEGKYDVDNDDTLFYLPHVAILLSNNLLWKNWKPEKLSKIILIQNSFDHIKTNTIHSDLLRELYVGKIMKYANEYIPNHDYTNKKEYKYESAFNNTSIHEFPKENLDKITEENFWTDCAEPMPNTSKKNVTKELQAIYLLENQSAETFENFFVIRDSDESDKEIKKLN